MNPSPYELEWREYRKRRNWLFGVFLTYVPATSLFAWASIHLFGTFAPAFVLAFGWMAAFLVTGIRYNSWRCPRCGNIFSAKWWYNLSFVARHCVHCGLPKP